MTAKKQSGQGGCCCFLISFHKSSSNCITKGKRGKNYSNNLQGSSTTQYIIGFVSSPSEKAKRRTCGLFRIRLYYAQIKQQIYKLAKNIVYNREDKLTYFNNSHSINLNIANKISFGLGKPDNNQFGLISLYK